ncbi:hypothetical protein Tco_0007429 [Tanacetum coccineum]
MSKKELLRLDDKLSFKLQTYTEKFVDVFVRINFGATIKLVTFDKGQMISFYCKFIGSFGNCDCWTMNRGNDAVGRPYGFIVCVSHWIVEFNEFAEKPETGFLSLDAVIKEDMDSEFAHMVAASKVSMLKPENGNTAPKTIVVEGVKKLKFNSIKDAKLLLEAIEKRFGGNAATKKTQRNLLEHQYENITTPSLETLDQTFNKL